MAKSEFPLHNNSEAFQNLKQSKLNGVELRKSHFLFGSDPTTFKKIESVSQLHPKMQAGHYQIT
jgi:hypothetical protein